MPPSSTPTSSDSRSPEALPRRGYLSFSLFLSLSLSFSFFSHESIRLVGDSFVSFEVNKNLVLTKKIALRFIFVAMFKPLPQSKILNLFPPNVL